MDPTIFTQTSQLPLVLNVNDISMVLQISRANAYNLLHRQDFPTLHIGKRMMTSKHRFLQWVEDNTW